MSCLSPELAVDFVAGALPEGPARDVEAHMARCHECRRLIVEVARAGEAPKEEESQTDRDAAVVGVANTVRLLASPVPRTPVRWTDTRSSVERSGGASSTTASEPTYELRRGARVGRYTLLYPLGEGGMGSVFAAFDPKLDRRVALKFLRTDLLGTAEQGHRQRLVREARALARLSHANVVSIYDVAETDGSVFLAMELIDGTNARIWRDLGNRSVAQVHKVYCEALEALLAAHEQGIVHRDFKPDNVMVGADGIARVTDFGLARAAMVDVDILLADAEAQGTDWETLTQTGLVLGTPRYMAPEQFRGIANELTDQFSFCLSMYEALCGHYPLGTRTPRGLLEDRPLPEQILDPLDKGTIPESLRKILIRGLAIDPKDRWQNSSELLFELKRALVPAPSKMRWGTLASIGVAVAGAAYFIAPPPPSNQAPAVAPAPNYAAELADLKREVAEHREVALELARSQARIRELEIALEERDDRLAILAMQGEAKALRRTARPVPPTPLPGRSVERSVTTRLSEILACYEDSVEDDLSRVIKVRVGIDEHGTVKWVTPPLADRSNAAPCVTRAIKKLSFPASASATSATLTFSFFRLESGMLAINMRAKTRNATLGQVTVDSEGRIHIDCDLKDPLCGL